MENNNFKIIDRDRLEGGFAVFQLDNVSYFPAREVQKTIALNIYGVDLEKSGIFDSEKYQNEKRHASISTPLRHCDVEGDFILFIPEGKPPWGMMDIRQVNHDRLDVNLSIIPRTSLIPHQLSIVRGSVCNDKALFVVVDRDGSSWTLHYKKRKSS